MGRNISGHFAVIYHFEVIFIPQRKRPCFSATYTYSNWQHFSYKAGKPFSGGNFRNRMTLKGFIQQKCLVGGEGIVFRQRGNCCGCVSVCQSVSLSVCLSVCDIHIVYRTCSGRQIPGKKYGKKKASEFSNNKALFNISSPTIIIRKSVCTYSKISYVI
jgi:hypothetical protein